MRKIGSLFKRDYEGARLVYNEVASGAEWMLEDFAERFADVSGD